MAEPKYTISADTGKSAKREMMITALNTGTAASPAWKALGKKVEESSIDLDWGDETKKDILGHVYTTAQKPTKEQEFSGNNFIGGDDVMNYISDLAIVKEDFTALTQQECLIIHTYLTDSTGKAFAERYSECSILPSSLGGVGGGVLISDVTVKYGGTRTTGTATYSEDGGITFTADSAA